MYIFAEATRRADSIRSVAVSIDFMAIDPPSSRNYNVELRSIQIGESIDAKEK